MREIKFRIISNNKEVGLERLTEKGWEWQYYELNPTKGVRWVHGTMETYDNPLIRNQFTGLKDKNSKEIYEWDILKIRPYIYTGTDILSVVEWNDRRAMFQAVEIREEDPDREYLHELLNEQHQTEVIGNIYENPDLL